MMKLTAILLNICASAPWLLVSCTSLSNSQINSASESPDKLVQTLFEDRVKSTQIFVGSGASLKAVRQFFVVDLRNEIDNYINQEKMFYRNFETSDVPQLANVYLRLYQFDILSRCSSPPRAVKVKLLSKTDQKYQFRVIYTLIGNWRAPYESTVTVSVKQVNGQWLIDEVNYDKPSLIDPLDHVHSMSDTMKLMAYELQAATDWAENHRDEIRSARQERSSFGRSLR